MGKATAHVFLGAFIAAALVGGDPAGAGPVEDAAAAYKRGDYATAMRLFRPLADEGDASAQVVLGFMYCCPVDGGYYFIITLQDKGF
jgi:hypothetical protein